MSGLNAVRQPPIKGPAKILVVLCHGYGGTGAQMARLAPALQRYLPTAAFVSPDGPFRTLTGHCWFRVNLLRMGDRQQFMRGAIQAGPTQNAFFDAELARLKLEANRLILVGFSQGAITTLNTGLRRSVPPAALVAFAGAMVVPEGLPKSRGTPVMLIQGAEDQQFRDGRAEIALKTLKAAGAAATSHTLPGLGHSIDDRGIRLAGEFLRDTVRGKA